MNELDFHRLIAVKLVSNGYELPPADNGNQEAEIQDGTIKYASPPLKALLHIMAYDQYNGLSIHDPKIRAMFTREALLKSEWYKERLVIKQQRDISLKRHIMALEDLLEKPGYADEAKRLSVHKKLSDAQQELAHVMSDKYLKGLVGTVGADPIVFEDTVAQ